MKAKAFIFDLDGTLVDSVDAHVVSWVKAFNSVASVHVCEDDIRPLIGLSGRDIMKAILGKDADEGLLRKVRWVKDRAFLKEVGEGRVELFPGVTQALRLLKAAGYLIGLASSTPNRMLVHLTDYLGLSNFMDAITGGDEVSKGKPNPAIFKLTARKLGVPPSATVIVGDTPYDVIPAKALGATPVLVNYNSELAKMWRDPIPEGTKVYVMFYELTDYLRKVVLGCEAAGFVTAC